MPKELYADYKNLNFEIKERIANVTLNRPSANNRLSIDLLLELESVADSLQMDTETRVVVFTGAGKNFSLGADVFESEQQDIFSSPVLKRFRSCHGPRVITKLNKIPQITIAAINGICLGGGTCVASALDFRIGAENCRCSLPENNLGMNLSWLALPLVLNLIGPTKTKEFVILGRNEDAKTLLDWGWLDEVVPPEKLMDRAMEMAKEYASRPPLTTQMIKRSVNALTQALDHAIMHMDADQFILSSMTDDFKEGIGALIERRSPDFKGA